MLNRGLVRLCVQYVAVFVAGYHGKVDYTKDQPCWWPTDIKWCGTYGITRNMVISHLHRVAKDGLTYFKDNPWQPPPVSIMSPCIYPW